MKLRHALAGTVALPLALAVASTASAATIVDNENHRLNVGGFVAAQAGWIVYDDAKGQDSDINYNGMSLGTSRLNVTYTQKTNSGDITAMYENDWAAGDYRLRHAVISYDGWKAGFTWSAFANLTALGETIDAAGHANWSAPSNRTASLGRNFDLGNDMSVGLFVEDRKLGITTGSARSERTSNTPLPDLVANFSGNFGMANVFAAVEMVQVDKAVDAGDDAEAEAVINATFGTNLQVNDDLSVKAAFTNWDGDDNFLSVGAQMKFSDQLRTNFIVEQALRDMDDADYTAIWANAFYTMPSGWEWGAEVRYVIADDNVGLTKDELNDATGLNLNAADFAALGLPGAVNGLRDGDMMFSLQAKYAF